MTKLDYECLFFPQIAGGQYTHPRRAPRAPSNDGVWGGLSADADGNGDNECGILVGEGDGAAEAKAAAAEEEVQEEEGNHTAPLYSVSSPATAFP